MNTDMNISYLNLQLFHVLLGATETWLTRKSLLLIFVPRAQKWLMNYFLLIFCEITRTTTLASARTWSNNMSFSFITSELTTLFRYYILDSFFYFFQLSTFFFRLRVRHFDPPADWSSTADCEGIFNYKFTIIIVNLSGDAIFWLATTMNFVHTILWHYEYSSLTI